MSLESSCIMMVKNRSTLLVVSRDLGVYCLVYCVKYCVFSFFS